MADISIALDITSTLPADLAVLTRNLQVTHKVLTEHGPGGGNPIVKFTGPYGDIEALLWRHNDSMDNVTEVRTALMQAHEAGDPSSLLGPEVWATDEDYLMDFVRS